MTDRILPNLILLHNRVEKYVRVHRFLVTFKENYISFSTPCFPQFDMSHLSGRQTTLFDRERQLNIQKCNKERSTTPFN